MPKAGDTVSVVDCGKFYSYFPEEAGERVEAVVHWSGSSWFRATRGEKYYMRNRADLDWRIVEDGEANSS